MVVMDDTVAPILSITDAARDKILEVRAAEPDAATLALWVTVTGESGGAYTYDMSFRALDDAGSLEVVQHHDDLPVVIDGDAVEVLVGATLDFTAAGMVMQNPNKPAPRVASLEARAAVPSSARNATGKRGISRPAGSA